MSSVDLALVAQRLQAVVAAMKENLVWDVPRPPDEAFVDPGPFGMRSMSFEQWLRWCFVPEVEKRLANNGPWPESSGVALSVWRNGDGNPPVAALYPSVKAFDDVFLERPALSAAQLYDQARSLFASGDGTGARLAIEQAVALEPGFPNAHNFAGWVYLNAPARNAADLESAISHFRAAIAAKPSDDYPYANLANALVAAERVDEAIATMRQYANELDVWAAHHWLSWFLNVRCDDLASALVHGERSTALRPRWGASWMHLAWTLDRADQAEKAYAAYGSALGCPPGEFDKAYAHGRRAWFEGAWGRHRMALRSARHALVLDSGNDATRTAWYQGLATVAEQNLAALGVSFPGAATELRWIRSPSFAEPSPEALRSLIEELLHDLPATAETAPVRQMLSFLLDRAEGRPWAGMAGANLACDGSLLGPPQQAQFVKITQAWDDFYQAAWREECERESADALGKGRPFRICTDLFVSEHSPATCCKPTLESQRLGPLVADLAAVEFDGYVDAGGERWPRFLATDNLRQLWRDPERLLLYQRIFERLVAQNPFTSNDSHVVILFVDQDNGDPGYNTRGLQIHLPVSDASTIAPRLDSLRRYFLDHWWAFRRPIEASVSVSFAPEQGTWRGLPDVVRGEEPAFMDAS